MMYALYGTQGIYLEDVIAKGICRDTAAFFIVPDQPEEKKMKATLSCAIYHAAGLKVIRTAVDRCIMFREAIQKVRGIYITIHEIENYHEEDLISSTYLLAEQETYPYIKVKDMKDMRTVYLNYVQADPQYFGGHIMSEFNNERFFQKKGGKIQTVINCDMKKLGLQCKNVSNGICGKVLEKMRVTDDIRN